MKLLLFTQELFGSWIQISFSLLSNISYCPIQNVQHAAMSSENKLILSMSDFSSLTTWQEEILSSVFSDKVGIINAFLEHKELSSYGLSMLQALTTKTSYLFSLSKDV
ncbi:hypothetical protein QUB16_14320 [Microcoleus sp. D3_18a_C4]